MPHPLGRPSEPWRLVDAAPPLLRRRCPCGPAAPWAVRGCADDGLSATATEPGRRRGRGLSARPRGRDGDGVRGRDEWTA
jgi:hypothetical protein